MTARASASGCRGKRVTIYLAYRQYVNGQWHPWQTIGGVAYDSWSGLIESDYRYGLFECYVNGN